MDSFASPLAVKICVDSPRPGAPYPAHRIPVTGWVYAGERQDQIASIIIRDADTGACVGQTWRLFARPDVASFLGINAEVPTAFHLYASMDDFPAGGQRPDASLQAWVEWLDGADPRGGEPFPVSFVPADLHNVPYGWMLDPATTRTLHRHDIYGSGPSMDVADADLVALLVKHLPPPPCRVLDVGCGLGSYGQALLARGYDWMGAEVKDHDCAEMARRNVPHVQIAPDAPLPFADQSFDAVICIEVLEHVENTAGFLAELARVARRTAIFSVPNSELIPQMSARTAVPWHLLEGDHKNFFTRFNLAALLRQHFQSVQILDYGLHPMGGELGVQLPYHLLAVAGPRPPSPKPGS